MRSLSSFRLLIVIFHLLSFLKFVSAIEDKQYLTTSAVVSDPQNNNSAKVQCWQFTTPFSTYPTVGAALSLANISNITYVVLPPGGAEGRHNPPHAMFFVQLMGVAHVTCPEDPEDSGLWIVEGENPLIVAADVEGLGHFTDYPFEGESVALQLPFKDGVIPEHRVLHDSACTRKEQGTRFAMNGFWKVKDLAVEAARKGSENGQVSIGEQHVLRSENAGDRGN